MKLKKLPSLDDIVLAPRARRYGAGNVDVDFYFRRSARHYVGKPLIVGGAWEGEEAVRIANLGALVMIEPIDELTELLADGPGDDEEIRNFIERMVYPVLPDTVGAFEDMVDSLGQSLSPRYAWVSNDNPGHEVVKHLREKYPWLTTFSGSYQSAGAAALNRWADIAVIGHGFATPQMDEKFGMRLDLGEIVEYPAQGWASALGLTDPAHFVKSYALGADFCVIDPGFRENTFEELLGVIAGACYMLGADNPHQLPGSTQIGVR